MALKGTIETFPLISIFQLISNDQKTGTLRVTTGNQEVNVIIKEGTVVYAMSSKKEARLGRLLLNKGALSLKQLEQCLDEGRERKQALGKIVVEKGYIRIEELTEFIRKQVEGIIFDLFFWEKGEFEYNDSQLDLSRLVVTRLNIMNTVMEASRRLDELSVLKNHIPSPDIKFRPAVKNGTKNNIKLAPTEGKFYALVDGKRSVQELMDAIEEDEFTTYSALHTLMSSGLIEKIDESKPAQETQKKDDDFFHDIVAGYNEILLVIVELLHAKIGKQTYDLLSKSKPEVNPFQKGLFDNYHPNNAIETNTYVIREHLRSIKDKTVAHAVLVDAFNSLILNILTRVPVATNIEAAEQLLEKVTQKLPELKKYRTAKEGKPGISEHLKTVFAKASANFKGKQQTTEK